MKLLVLGGTGRTGSLVTRAALAAGHEVTFLVRDPSRVDSVDGLHVLTGDAKDHDAMDRALEGQDGLISALGPRSIMRSDIASPAASNFVPIAHSRRVRRVIVMSAFGVGETFGQSSLLVRAAFSTVLRSLCRDKTSADDIVKRSALDWTLVHPVTLTDDVGAGRVTATERLTGRDAKQVSRADVADFLVACLKQLGVVAKDRDRDVLSPRPVELSQPKSISMMVSVGWMSVSGSKGRALPAGCPGVVMCRVPVWSTR